MDNYQEQNRPDPGDDPMIDPSDTFDTERFDEWEVPNTDYTAEIPPIAGTVPAPPSEASRAFDAMFGGPVQMLAGLLVRPGSGA